MKRVNHIKRPKSGMNVKLTNKKALNKQLAAVYQANKELIKKKFALPEGDKRRVDRVFKSYVKAQMDDGSTLNQALNQLERSRIFTSKEDIYKENVMKALKKADLSDEFRRIRGWKEKFEYEKLKFEKKENKEAIYSYGDVRIAISDSPTGEGGVTVRLWKI